MRERLTALSLLPQNRVKEKHPLRVSYATENTIRMKPRYSNFDLLNSQETMGLYQEMNDKGYFGIRNALYGRRAGVYHELYRGLSTIDPATGQYQIANTPEARNAFLREREYANTDWFDLLLRLTPQPTTSLHLLWWWKERGNIRFSGFLSR